MNWLKSEGEELIKYPGNDKRACCKSKELKMPRCTHVLILDLSPHSDLTSTSVCCCSPVFQKAWYLCVKCASTPHFGKEPLHQSSQTQASNSNQRLLYSQVTQGRKPSRNILQLPCGWLSSSFWPSFIGTWHTWAQL